MDYLIELCSADLGERARGTSIDHPHVTAAKSFQVRDVAASLRQAREKSVSIRAQRFAIGGAPCCLGSPAREHAASGSISALRQATD
jgi:hypothetical protein